MQLLEELSWSVINSGVGVSCNTSAGCLPAELKQYMIAGALENRHFLKTHRIIGVNGNPMFTHFSSFFLNSG